MDSSSPLYHLPPVSARSAAGLYGEALGVVAAVIGGVLWATTQWLAWRLHFDPVLGAPLLEVPTWARASLAIGAASAALVALAFWLLARHRRRVPWLAAIALAAALLALGPVYAPWQFLVWDWHLGDQPALESLFTTGHWAIAVPSHGALFLAIWVASRRARGLATHSDSHGSARWASDLDVEQSGLATGRGVFLALESRGSGGRSRYLRHDGPQHVLGFAPSRSAPCANEV